MEKRFISIYKKPLLFVLISGISFGIFIRMVHIYVNRESLMSLFDLKTVLFALGGALIYVSVWLAYSAFINRYSKTDILETLHVDSISYLPSLLLLFYVFQFTPPFESVNQYFASSYTQFSERFFLLPAKILLLFVLNCIIFLKITSNDYWVNKLKGLLSSNKRSAFILVFLMGAYVITYTTMSILQFKAFYTEWDLALYDQALWNTLRGRILMNTLEVAHYDFNEISHFAVHVSPIYLLIAPVYAIYPGVPLLLFLQTLALAAGAIPIYWLAKEKFGNMGGVVFSATYLLYPSLAYINLFDFHEAAFAVPFLLFTFYYFQKKDFKKFFLFMLLTISIKEAISLVVFMFGIYALAKKRDKKWILAPAIIGALWFLVSIYLILPYYSKGASPYFLGEYYSHLGGDPIEIVKTIVFHPLYVLKLVLVPAKLVYLLQIFLPLSFMSFVSPSILVIALPIFMQNLLGDYYALYSINFQYTADLIPFIIISAIYGTEKLLSSNIISRWNTKVQRKFFDGGRSEKRSKANLFYAFMFFILLNGLITNIVYSPSPIGTFFNEEKITVDHRSIAANHVLGKIPNNAPVSAQVPYLSHLSHRAKLYSLWDKPEEHFEKYGDVEYAVVDTLRTFPEISDTVIYLLTSNDWGVLYEEEGHILFKKNITDKIKLFKIFDKEPSIQYPIKVTFSNKIEFLGYDIDKKKVAPSDVIRLTYYWKSLKKVKENYTISVSFIDENENVVFNRKQRPTYWAHQTSEWVPGEIIKETHSILVPRDIKKGRYNIKICIQTLNGDDCANENGFIIGAIDVI